MPVHTPDASPPADAAWISVREVMSPPGTELPASAPFRLAVETVLRGPADRLWLTDPVGRLAGEVDAAALLRAEVRGVPGERPVGSLSDPVAPLDEASDAAAAVVRLGRGEEARVPVVRGGVLIGELTRRDVLGLVHGVRCVAGVANVPLPAESRPAPPQPAPPQPEAAPAEVRSVGPAAPRFLSRRPGVRSFQESR